MTVADVEFGFVASGRQLEGMPSTEDLRRLPAVVEELGFDAIWAGDHIAPGQPVLEAVVALSYFAARTSRVAIGAGVLLLPLRHPTLVAKQIATLDHLSGGRVVLGIGVGGDEPGDFTAVGVPLGERGARADESIDALRRLWSDGPTTHDGDHYDFRDVEILPPPAQPSGPPIIVGGRSGAALRRTGRRGDGWLGHLASPGSVRDAARAIRSHARAAGREPSNLPVGVMLPTLVDSSGGRARRRMGEHLRRRYGRDYERHVIDRYCAAGEPEEIASRVYAYVEAGATRIVFLPASPPEAQLDAAQDLHRGVVEPLRERIGAHDG